MQYLIHFAAALPGGGRQCLGFTDAADYSGRLADHRAGRGAKILAECVRRGTTFDVVRTWRGGRPLERRLKNRGHQDRLCPICRKTALERQAYWQRAVYHRRAGTFAACGPAPL